MTLMTTTHHTTPTPQWVKAGWLLAHLGLLILLVGCSGGLPAPQPLHDLHLPGVNQVPGITTIHKGINQGKISAVTTYQVADSSSTTHIVFLLDGGLYDVQT